jgi:hypothetical protein
MQLSKRPVLCAAVTAVSTVGLLSVAPAANAAPPGACTFARDQFGLSRDDNTVMGVTAAPNGTGLGPVGTWFLEPTPSTSEFDRSHGNVTGGINGRVVEFTIDYTDGPVSGTSAKYHGDIADDGSVSGDSFDYKNPKVSWHTEPGMVNCGGGDGGAATTVTVLKPTDIYSGYDGNGTTYPDANGNPIFKAPGQAQLVPGGFCRRNWCHVVAPEVPPGEGWIYIGEGMGSIP